MPSTPPLRVLFGAFALDLLREEYASKLAEWGAWSDLSVGAHGLRDASANGV